MIKRTREELIGLTYMWSHLKTTRGQVAVEYILLLSIGVALAALITSTVVSRDPEAPGFLIAKWRQIIDLIGNHVIDP